PRLFRRQLYVARPLAAFCLVDNEHGGRCAFAPVLVFPLRDSKLLDHLGYAMVGQQFDGLGLPCQVDPRVLPERDHRVLHVRSTVVHHLQMQGELHIVTLLGYVVDAVTACEIAPVFGKGAQRRQQQDRKQGRQARSRRKTHWLHSFLLRKIVGLPDARRPTSTRHCVLSLELVRTHPTWQTGVNQNECSATSEQYLGGKACPGN